LKIKVGGENKNEPNFRRMGGETDKNSFLHLYGEKTVLRTTGVQKGERERKRREPGKLRATIDLKEGRRRGEQHLPGQNNKERWDRLFRDGEKAQPQKEEGKSRTPWMIATSQNGRNT